jgi:hypothetical protein
VGHDHADTSGPVEMQIPGARVEQRDQEVELHLVDLLRLRIAVLNDRHRVGGVEHGVDGRIAGPHARQHVIASGEEWDAVLAVDDLLQERGQPAVQPEALVEPDPREAPLAQEAEVGVGRGRPVAGALGVPAELAEEQPLALW